MRDRNGAARPTQQEVEDNVMLTGMTGCADQDTGCADQESSSRSGPCVADRAVFAGHGFDGQEWAGASPTLQS